MIRLRHASQINGREANEIILLNSHDGTSSYQMLAGMFRFVCQNGLVCGDTVADVRVPHKGDRSEEHTSELQSLMRISYAVFCLKKKTSKNQDNDYEGSDNTITTKIKK